MIRRWEKGKIENWGLGLNGSQGFYLTKTFELGMIGWSLNKKISQVYSNVDSFGYFSFEIQNLKRRKRNLKRSSLTEQYGTPVSKRAVAVRLLNSIPYFMYEYRPEKCPDMLHKCTLSAHEWFHRYSAPYQHIRTRFQSVTRIWLILQSK